MARKRLELGAHGEIQLSRQKRVDGKWVKVDRGGTRVRARCLVRGYDGESFDAAGFGTTNAKAEASLHEQIAQRLRSEDDALTAATPLVVAGRRWVADIARTDSGLATRSVFDYTATFTRYIDKEGSTIRGLTLREADDPGRLTTFLRKVADEHGNGAAKQTRVVLGHIFRLAVRNRALKTTPMRDVEPVRSQVPKATLRDTNRVYTPAERDHLLAYAYELAQDESLNPRTTRKRWATADLFTVLAYTGLRIEEARSLRWVDVDLLMGTMIVNGTKSASAIRRINLASRLSETLTARAARSGTEGLLIASPAHVDQPDKPWEQSNSSNELAAVSRAAGYTWATPHTFRHAITTDFAAKGVPLAQIADWLGHKDIAVTARYLGRDFGSDKTDMATLL